MAIAFHGFAGINWGVNSTIIGVNGLFQTRDHAVKVEKRRIRDGGNTTVSLAYFDQAEYLSFTYVAYQFGVNRGNATVQTPSIGQWVQVTDPTYGYVSGFWLCEDIQTNASNTSAVKVTVMLARYPKVPRV